ncbi:hypothetical protein N0B31_15735 [Salinirubellus salinus]|jgi:hypothetical protein|uniref:Uncharacterized protein n=1 Tax=Salinirubellus salinus TaxID=1364945 RepID=A0A9E7UA24_9EURY|nr:hypothetical protein [Salinirubellus salinus]UWM53582.1 hypothetical protein N0B31_15735 [Salinirubellus salinus]
MTAPDPQPYDHYRAADGGPLPAGTYRVVGTRDGVTLLYVTDDGGRRVHAGRLERVDRATLADLTPVEGPDDDADIGTALYYSARAVPGNLVARPVQVTLAVALFALSVVGPGVVSLPPLAFEAAEVLAALALGTAAAGLPRTGR